MWQNALLTGVSGNDCRRRTVCGGVTALSAQPLTPAGGNDIGAPLLAEGLPEPKSMRLGFVAGTIAEDKLHSFERLLFRATRGNMFLKHSSVGTVVDPTTTEKVEKAVFVVFFAGERARSKVLKVGASTLLSTNQALEGT